MIYASGSKLLKAVVAVTAFAHADTGAEVETQGVVHDLADSGVEETKLSLTPAGGEDAAAAGGAGFDMADMMAKVQSGNLDVNDVVNNLPKGVVPDEAMAMLNDMGGVDGVKDMAAKLANGEGLDEAMNKAGDMLEKFGGSEVAGAFKSIQESGVADMAKGLLSGEADPQDMLKNLAGNEAVGNLINQFGGEGMGDMLKNIAGGSGDMGDMLKNLTGAGGNMEDMLKNLPEGTLPEGAGEMLSKLGGMSGIEDLVKNPTAIMDKLGDGTIGKMAESVGLGSVLEAVGGESGVGEIISKVQEGDVDGLMNTVGGVEGVAQMLDAAPGLEGVSDMLEPFGGFEGAAEKAQNLVKEVGGVEGAQKIVENVQKTAQTGVEHAFGKIGGLEKITGVVDDTIEAGVESVGTVIEDVLANEDLQKAIDSLGMADMFNDFLGGFGGVDGIKENMRNTLKTTVSDTIGDLETQLTGKKSKKTLEKESRMAKEEARKKGSDEDDEEECEAEDDSEHGKRVAALGLTEEDIATIMKYVSAIPDSIKEGQSDEAVMQDFVEQFGTEGKKEDLIEEIRTLVEEEIPNMEL